MTKMKKALSAFLLAFVFLSVGYLMGKERGRRLGTVSPTISPSALPAALPTARPSERATARNAAPPSAAPRVAVASPVPHVPSSAIAAAPETAAIPTPYPTPIPPRYAPGETHVTVFFFHRKERCATCRKIEEWTGSTMGDFYSADLEDGKMEWRVYCLEDASAAQFREQFDLFTSTVVLAEVREGKVVRFKDLVEDVWLKVDGSQEDFMKYLKDEIDAFRTVNSEQSTVNSERPTGHGEREKRQ